MSNDCVRLSLLLRSQAHEEDCRRKRQSDGALSPLGLSSISGLDGPDSLTISCLEVVGLVWLLDDVALLVHSSVHSASSDKRRWLAEHKEGRA